MGGPGSGPRKGGKRKARKPANKNRPMRNASGKRASRDPIRAFRMRAAKKRAAANKPTRTIMHGI